MESVTLNIQLTEPSSARHIYINPENNTVHLMVPIVGGEGISTDNTCKSSVAVDEFFNGAALRELTAYKRALKFDLKLLNGDDFHLASSKQERLAQINAYIAAVPAMKTEYKNAVNALKQERTNLYSMQLRPSVQDPVSPVINPVFTVNRRNDLEGNPLSSLYQALQAVNIENNSPLNPLKKAVIAELDAESVDFEDIRRVLTEKCQHLFGLTVDFTKQSDGSTVDKAYIDDIMSFSPEQPATNQEYIDALLRACAPNLLDNVEVSPFYKTSGDQKEQLSILTQFFLAHVNIYCVENELSHSNFGDILDASPALSKELADILIASIDNGLNVEENLCNFVNKHQEEFGLSRPLALTDMQSITQRFTRNYTTIKDSAHMDDFMILNTKTNSGKFVTHQGSICTDFSELVFGSRLDNKFFKHVRDDFEKPKSRIIPHKNEHIKESIELLDEDLLSRITNDEISQLDFKTRYLLNGSPLIQSKLFLEFVATGKQDEAQQQIENNPGLLLARSLFTDYSGRSFYCTAYEYAYWAKDAHMCRMLEEHMDEKTKAIMLSKVIDIDNDGLDYVHNKVLVKNSKHFDLDPLRLALANYMDLFKKGASKELLHNAWMQVGLAQRDLPAHVINEYCRPDISLKSRPEFNADNLPRSLTYKKNSLSLKLPLFPLVLTETEGLGVDFALTRNNSQRMAVGSTCSNFFLAQLDLEAINLLDEVKSAEIMQSRIKLSSESTEINDSAREHPGFDH